MRATRLLVRTVPHATSSVATNTTVLVKVTSMERIANWRMHAPVHLVKTVENVTKQATVRLNVPASRVTGEQTARSRTSALLTPVIKEHARTVEAHMTVPVPIRKFMFDYISDRSHYLALWSEENPEIDLMLYLKCVSEKWLLTFRTNSRCCVYCVCAIKWSPSKTCG
jgi:hypothetical protein